MQVFVEWNQLAQPLAQQMYEPRTVFFVSEGKAVWGGCVTEEEITFARQSMFQIFVLEMRQENEKGPDP